MSKVYLKCPSCEAYYEADIKVVGKVSLFQCPVCLCINGTARRIAITGLAEKEHLKLFLEPSLCESNNSQRKKDESSLLGVHLETRSKTGEDNTREDACGCGNHVDTSKSKDDFCEDCEYYTEFNGEMVCSHDTIKYSDCPFLTGDKDTCKQFSKKSKSEPDNSSQRQEGTTDDKVTSSSFNNSEDTSKSKESKIKQELDKDYEK